MAELKQSNKDMADKLNGKNDSISQKMAELEELKANLAKHIQDKILQDRKEELLKRDNQEMVMQIDNLRNEIDSIDKETKRLKKTNKELKDT